MSFTQRAGIILSLLLSSNVFVWGLVVNQEIKQQRIWSKVKAPLQQLVVSTSVSNTAPISQEVLEPTIFIPSPSPQPTPKVVNRTIIRNEVKVIYPTQKPQPTIQPGRPGSPEWDAEFWKKWDEMSAHNAQMQQQVEESQKKFCLENPTLCD